MPIVLRLSSQQAAAVHVQRIFCGYIVRKLRAPSGLVVWNAFLLGVFVSERIAELENTHHLS